MSILAESAAIMLGDIKNDTEPLAYRGIRTLMGTEYEQELYVGDVMPIEEEEEEEGI